jgi:hypothetical protein
LGGYSSSILGTFEHLLIDRFSAFQVFQLPDMSIHCYEFAVLKLPPFAAALGQQPVAMYGSAIDQDDIARDRLFSVAVDLDKPTLLHHHVYPRLMVLGCGGVRGDEAEGCHKA